MNLSHDPEPHRIDSVPAPPRPGRLLLLLFLACFPIAYSQAPLYYSNQNQYFLHGLAQAGEGFLHEDWLAGTADPTPLFSALVAVTARWLHPWVLHAYFALLQAVYAAALVGLFAWLAGPEVGRRRWPLFLALLLLVHAAVVRWLSYQLFGLDYPWYLQAGVAGQYVLGGMLQPSVFGVLLIVAVCLFAQERPYAAVACLVFGATIHSTYLLPAALFTAGFMTALAGAGQVRRAIAVGATALVLVLPVTLYVWLQFQPTSPEAFARAQDILVNVRIPHHCLPRLWLDPIAALQIAWIAAGVGLCWGTPLFWALGVPFVLAALLTVAQVATGSNTLALLFPWRISALLVPIATAVVLGRLVASARLPLDGRAVQVLAVAALVVLAAGGVWTAAVGAGFRAADEELPLLDFVRRNRKPHQTYLLPVRVPDLAATTRGSASSDYRPLAAKRQDNKLIPVDLQRFRLHTGVPIYVDFKSIPYRDVDVIEWHERLTRAQRLHAQLEKGRLGALFELQELGVTHFVRRTGPALHNPFLLLVHADDAYEVYRWSPK